MLKQLFNAVTLGAFWFFLLRWALHGTHEYFQQHPTFSVWFAVIVLGGMFLKLASHKAQEPLEA